MGRTRIEVDLMTDFKYQVPPSKIKDLIDTSPPPFFSLSPDYQYVAMLDPIPYVTLIELFHPEVKLAGLSVHTKSHAPARAGRKYQKITFFRLNAPANKTVIVLSKDSNCILSFVWSPKGDKVAYALAHLHGVDLVIASPTTGKTKRLVKDRLNCIYGNAFFWSSDGSHVICKLRPHAATKPPVKPALPSGPVTYESQGGESPARTYPDVLRTPDDANLLEYYLQSQICLVSLDGDIEPITSFTMIRTVIPSPDGRYLLISRVERPFSYSVLINRFQHRYEIIDKAGSLIREIGYQPLDEQRPIGHDAVSKGVREAVWSAFQPATIFWVEAQDGGDHRTEADIRDKILRLDAPFDAVPSSFMALSYRFQDIWWTEQGQTLVLEEWWKTKRKRYWLIRADSPVSTPQNLFDLSSEDSYNDPGAPMLRRSPAGTVVMATLQNGRMLIFAGKGASPDGDRPFLDILDIESLATKRVWRSEAPHYEEPLALVDENNTILVTIRESGTEPPNLFLRSINSNSIAAVTRFPHPYPSLLEIRKELIAYKRSDGVQLSATLYLPAGYTSQKGPLPALIWAYPREFTRADNAGQIKGSPYKFPVLTWGSPLYWLTQGYAILDGPSMPIIGEKDLEPNDLYIEQLTMSAQAAVDMLVKREVADPDMIAIGGHSYGAFMAVNLLAHTDIFKAGIARSGAYNRTLTPFGFQNEDRDLWKARDTYVQLSPYIWADQIKSPLLILHGADDNNPGTNPIQSQLLYQALKGLGKTARLVMFPKEGHQYRSKETVMHMAWEINRWMDMHVKNVDILSNDYP